jgi:hypothetical protein
MAAWLTLKVTGSTIAIAQTGTEAPKELLSRDKAAEAG